MAERYFADSFYFIAMFSPRDAAHVRAVGFAERAHGRIVTTDAVLLEFADALSS